VNATRNLLGSGLPFPIKFTGVRSPISHYFEREITAIVGDHNGFVLIYAIDRYAMEAKRQLDLLDKNLAERQYICGDEYTIADMAIWPWYGAVVRILAYSATEFLETHTYTNLIRGIDEVGQRPAVKRGQMVNRPFGNKSRQLLERHDASDFELRTQDILDLDLDLDPS
jgi:hypothetical protein